MSSARSDRVSPTCGDIIPCCVHLRVRSMQFDPDEMRAGPGHIRVNDTGGYWCDRTKAVLGPDDECALPATCQTGRECFHPATD